ncbi:MAG: right-handed parallel beta-helix repeat-containing protein [Planctomycetes bacterium]|nr:right-handed parallel beta-helix repeat-containing protein [Planctomycetota bacterium]
MNQSHHKHRTSILRPIIGLFLLVAGGLSACSSTRHNSVEGPESEARSTLTLESNSACESTGYLGGVVTPSQWRLRVVNHSGVGAAWRIVSDQAWLTIPIALGSTAPRAESAIIACIDPDAARTLGVGEHRAQISLHSAKSESNPGDTIEVVLRVKASGKPVALPLGDGQGLDTESPAPAGGGASALIAVDAPDTGYWTDLQPSADSRRIYVSSSVGSDTFSGLSPDLPKATIAAGKALMRDGFPDWLLLKRGDTWIGSFGQWLVSGRSANEPAVLTSYGTDTLRPKLSTGTGDGLFTIQNNVSPDVLRHIRIVGIRFSCEGHTGSEGTPRGINWHVPFEDLLIEDCAFQYFHTNIVIEPLGEHGRDFRLRRSIVADAFTTQNSHSQGLYVANTEGVLLEENVFDHNGWREDIAGAVPTIFRHNVYLQTDVTTVRAIGNIFASGASHGLQAREGGLVEDNLFVNNAIALLLGSDWKTKEPIRFIARRNVITGGRDLDPANLRGFGIDVPTAASGLIARNLIVNQGNAGFPVAMSLYDGTTASGLHDVIVEGNIVHNWGGGVLIQGQAPRLTGFAFRQNLISETRTDNPLVENTGIPNGSIAECADNLLWSQNAPANGWCRLGRGNVSLDQWKSAMADSSTQAELPPYFDSTRTVQEYDKRLGGPGTLASFMAVARRQSRTNWQPQYTAPVTNDWIRAGFRWAD